MRVEVQDVGLVEFPDDATDQEIQDALNSSFYQPPQDQSATFGSNVGEALSRPQPPLQLSIPYTGIPESMAPAVNWEQFQQAQGWSPTEEDRLLGIPSAAGITPESVPSGQRLTEMVVGLPPQMGGAMREQVPMMRALDVPMTIGSSVAKAGLGVGEYLTSPQGITELVLSMTPARLLVMGKWAYDMGKGAYSEAGTLGRLLAKENKTPEDWQQISDHTINSLVMGLGAGFLGKSALSEAGKLIQGKPEGKIPVEYPDEALRAMEEQYNLNRQIEAGSPFVRAEAPPQLELPPGVQGAPFARPISMGVRTQPQLSQTFDPFQPTFDPSGLRLAEPAMEVPAGLPQPVQPPAPSMAPGPRPVTATRTIRLSGEAQQRLADWEKSMSEKVAQEQAQPVHPDKPLTENQLRIIQDSLRQAVLENQIPGRRPGLIADGPLEAWADQVFQNAKEQNLKFGGGSDRMIAAGVIKIAAMIERGVTDIAQLTADIIREFGEGARPFIPQMLGEVKKLRAETEKGGENSALYQKTDALLRDVQQQEIPPEGAGRLPADEGRPQAPEARQENVVEAGGRKYSAQEWSDADFESYNKMIAEQKRLLDSGKIITADGNFTPEWQELMTRFEALRNLHNGMPPIQISIANELGVEYRGALKAGGKETWSFHDPKTGSNIGIPRGSTFEQARAKIESKRAEFVEESQPKGGVERGLQEKGQEKEVTPPAPVTEAPDIISKSPIATQTLDNGTVYKFYVLPTENGYAAFFGTRSGALQAAAPSRTTLSEAYYDVAQMVKPAPGKGDIVIESDQLREILGEPVKPSSESRLTITDYGLGEEAITQVGGIKAAIDVAAEKLRQEAKLERASDVYDWNTSNKRWGQVWTEVKQDPSTREWVVVGGLEGNLKGLDVARFSKEDSARQFANDFRSGKTFSILNAERWQRMVQSAMKAKPLSFSDESFLMARGRKLGTDLSGNQVTATDLQRSYESRTPDIISKLESLKFKEGQEGRLYTFPHPDAIKQIGRTAWNNAVDVAIKAIRAGKSVAAAIDEAIAYVKKNAKGFNENQLRANIEFVTKYEAKTAPTKTEPSEKLKLVEPVEQPTSPATKANLDDVYKRFIPEPEQKPGIGSRIKAGAVGSLEAVRTGFSSRFRPLDKLAEDIGRAYNLVPKRIAHIFEQLKGSSGKAEADVYRFDRDVSRLVRGSEKDFNAYIFLRRSLDRLRQDLADIQRAQAGAEVKDLNRRRVSGYTIPELEAKLATLEAKLGSEKTQTFQQAADLYQQHMDAALRLQVESGRMSQEIYDAIKSGNEFYAPFKILKYLDESSRVEGTGRKVDTVADFTKAMKGIDDPNFKLGDMLSAARQSITLSRVLAEKNNSMLKFAEMAADDVDGLYVRKLKPNESAPSDMSTVNVMEGGKTTKYAVDPAVAESVNFYNTPTSQAISTFLRISSAAFRAGATTANVAFQPVNLLLADAPRAALVSRYGIRGAADVVRYPLEMVETLFTSMEANLFNRKNKLYLDYLDSGAAGSVIQDYLSPKLLKYREPGVGMAASRFAKSILSKPAEFAKAIEEANKILGIKRAMRFEGVTSGKELARKIPEAITEVRRFSGSPDFGRSGSWTEAARLNLIHVFFNARVQGGVADIGRLIGRDGPRRAAKTWAKMFTAVGIPTAILYYYNNLPQFKADYDNRPEWEKKNYFLIPLPWYIEDETGQKIRDYLRIPKREIVQLVANLIESGMQFASERDPEAFSSMAVDMIENVSPVNIRGRNTQERIESALSSLNPIFKAPFEIATGRDLFRHRDIVPSEMMKRGSPEEQYTDRTPEIFKTLADLMPDAAPKVLRSPLMLEAAFRDFTANLITQFIPQKPVKGREGISNAPLLQPLVRRFQGSPYVDTEKERLEVEELQRQAADAFLAKDRAARSLIENVKDPNELLKHVFETHGTNEQAVVIAERALDLWTAEKNGITRAERSVLNLPVEQRAAYIIGKLKGLSVMDQTELMKEYVMKRILTDSVFEKMTELNAQQNAATAPPQ